MNTNIFYCICFLNLFLFKYFKCSIGDAHSLAQLAASSSSSGGGFLLKEGSNDLPSITTNDEGMN